MTDFNAHWAKIYTDKAPDEVSWFQTAPTLSLRLIAQAKLKPGALVVDLGSGVSPLVGALVAKDYSVTAVDISGPALEVAKRALGEKSKEVEWVLGDVTQWRPNQVFDLWHDRAVFHFMVTPEQRAAYVAALKAGLKPGAYAVLATFALDGPEKCSGLAVQRYDSAGLLAVLGPEFTLLAEAKEEHRTPWDAVQKFNYGLFRRG